MGHIYVCPVGRAKPCRVKVASKPPGCPHAGESSDGRKHYTADALSFVGGYRGLVLLDGERLAMSCVTFETRDNALAWAELLADKLNGAE